MTRGVSFNYTFNLRLILKDNRTTDLRLDLSDQLAGGQLAICSLASVKLTKGQLARFTRPKHTLLRPNTLIVAITNLTEF